MTVYVPLSCLFSKRVYELECVQLMVQKFQTKNVGWS